MPAGLRREAGEEKKHMHLIDNETKVDLLNNEPIAATVVKLLRESAGTAITVGLHGDWGAGKSSLLAMIEAAFVDDKDVVCLRFNGWLFQGFEDAKVVLLEGIVSELIRSVRSAPRLRSSRKT